MHAVSLKSWLSATDDKQDQHSLLHSTAKAMHSEHVKFPL